MCVREKDRQRVSVCVCVREREREINPFLKLFIFCFPLLISRLARVLIETSGTTWRNMSEPWHVKTKMFMSAQDHCSFLSEFENTKYQALLNVKFTVLF